MTLIRRAYHAVARELQDIRTQWRLGLLECRHCTRRLPEGKVNTYCSEACEDAELKQALS